VTTALGARRLESPPSDGARESVLATESRTPATPFSRSRRMGGLDTPGVSTQPAEGRGPAHLVCSSGAVRAVEGR